MSKLLVVGIIVLAFPFSQPVFAAIVTYDFSGSVTISSSTAYGYTIPALTSVHGAFSYDTDTAATTSGATSYYAQSLVGGFSVNFGNLAVSTSSYEITVSNDLLQPNGSFADIFGVSFLSNSDPAPSAPLIVGGTAENIGRLTLSFLGPSTLFSNSALPSSLSASSFSSKVGFFSQTPTNLIDVIFTATSIQSVPEPDSALLLLIGGLLALVGWWRPCVLRRIFSSVQSPDDSPQLTKRHASFSS